MTYLLDTCVLSKLRKIKKKPDPKLEKWISKHDESFYFISVLTIGEIQTGISKLNLLKNEEKNKKLILEDWFLQELIPRFQHRILAIDDEVAITWGKLVGKCLQKGISIPLVDGLIASTALTFNLTVVTENIKDFEQTGVRLFHPWM